MQTIIRYIIKLSVVLMILSIIGQQVSATKSDVERALDLLRQARAAIGGDSAIGSVQSLSINGRSNRRLQTPNEGEKQLNGEFELNMMLPDKLIRIEKIVIGTPDAKDSAQTLEYKQVQLGDAKIKIVREMEGPDEQKAMQHHEQSELAHYMLGLLLTPPPSFNAGYNYAGEGEVEGARADIIEVKGANGFTMKLFLDKSSHLPLMMSYQGSLPRIPIDGDFKAAGVAGPGEDKDVVIIRRQKNGDASGDEPQITFERKLDDNSPPADGSMMTFTKHVAENAEIQVRFSDFRSEGGLMLPHTLTHVVNGKVETVWTVERYEINSPTLSERFQKGFHWGTKQN